MRFTSNSVSASTSATGPKALCTTIFIKKSRHQDSEMLVSVAQPTLHHNHAVTIQRNKYEVVWPTICKHTLELRKVCRHSPPRTWGTPPTNQAEAKRVDASRWMEQRMNTAKLGERNHIKLSVKLNYTSAANPRRNSDLHPDLWRTAWHYQGGGALRDTHAAACYV